MSSCQYEASPHGPQPWVRGSASFYWLEVTDGTPGISVLSTFRQPRPDKTASAARWKL